MGFILQSIRVGIVGLGKIALEEHVPALQANAAFELVAAASAKASLEDVPSYGNFEEMLAHCPEIEAVAICTPPQAHFEAARFALQHGKHVLLEKPPCPTVAEFDELTALAAKVGRTLFQSWHARESRAVGDAVAWIGGRAVTGGRVVWKEDVRHWHPGQAWIWQDGGFGVLDAGINAISILTRLLPEPLTVEAAHLLVPANCVSPIAAAVAFRTVSGALIDADFDFRHHGDQARAMELDTPDGALTLAWQGAAKPARGKMVELGTQEEEYASLYARFADLIARGQSETDKRPLELVTEILAKADRSTVAPFSE